MSDTAPQPEAPADAPQNESNITSEPTAPTLPDEHPGVPDGQVLDTTLHDGQQVQEKVVYEYNDTSDPTRVTGWHKEAVTE